MSAPKPEGPHLAPAREAAEVPALPPAPPAPPRPLDQDLPRLALRAVQLLQAVRAALDAGDDCAAAAVKLGDVQRAFGDVALANAKLTQADRKAELLRALATQQGALDAAGAAVFHSRTLAKCVAEPEFAAALDHALGGP